MSCHWLPAGGTQSGLMQVLMNMTEKTPASVDAATDKIGAEGVADVPLGHNERDLRGMVGKVIFFTCVCYTLLHLYALNVSPIETWAFRIIHVAGGLVTGFALVSAFTLNRQAQPAPLSPLQWAVRLPTSLAVSLSAAGMRCPPAGCCLWWLGHWHQVPLPPLSAAGSGVREITADTFFGPTER